MLRMLETDYMITLAPEDSDKTFHVSRALLVTASSWFEKALDERFHEGQSRVLRLLDTNTETVENFLFWLHFGRSPFPKSRATHTEDVEGEEAHRAALIHFWAFGDKHFIPRMREIAVNMLTRSFEVKYGTSGTDSWPPLSLFKLGYNVSTVGSPLRALLSGVCIAGLLARLTSQPKTPRRRHKRRAGKFTRVVVSEGYNLADLADSPSELLIDVLKVFVLSPGPELQPLTLSEHLKQAYPSNEGDYTDF